MSYTRQPSLAPASWALVAITAWLCYSAHAASRQAVVLPSLQWREAGPDHVSDAETSHAISGLDALAVEQQLSLLFPAATNAAITKAVLASGAASNGRRALLAGPSRPKLRNSCTGKQVDPQTDAKAWNAAASLRQQLTSSTASFFSTLENTVFTTQMDWDARLTAVVAAGQPDAGAEAEPAGGSGEGSPGGVPPNALLDTTVYVQPVQMIGNAVVVRMAATPDRTPLGPGFDAPMEAKVIQVTPLGDLATPLASGEGDQETPGFSFKAQTPGAADGSGAGFNMIPADRTTVVPLGPDVKEELAVTEMLTGCTLVTAFDSKRQELHVTHIKPDFGVGKPIITGANMATLLQSSTLYFEGLPGVKANVFGRNGMQNGGYDENTMSQGATGFFMVAKTKDGDVAIVRQSTTQGFSMNPSATNPMLRRTALQFPIKQS